jgi:hypothetical protein
MMLGDEVMLMVVSSESVQPPTVTLYLTVTLPDNPTGLNTPLLTNGPDQPPPAGKPVRVRLPQPLQWVMVSIIGAPWRLNIQSLTILKTCSFALPESVVCEIDVASISGTKSFVSCRTKTVDALATLQVANDEPLKRKTQPNTNISKRGT